MKQLLDSVFNENFILDILELCQLIIEEHKKTNETVFNIHFTIGYQSILEGHHGKEFYIMDDFIVDDSIFSDYKEKREVAIKERCQSFSIKDFQDIIIKRIKEYFSKLDLIVEEYYFIENSHSVTFCIGNTFESFKANLYVLLTNKLLKNFKDKKNIDILSNYVISKIYKISENIGLNDIVISKQDFDFSNVAINTEINLGEIALKDITFLRDVIDVFNISISDDALYLLLFNLYLDEKIAIHKVENNKFHISIFKVQKNLIPNSHLEQYQIIPNKVVYDRIKHTFHNSLNSIVYEIPSKYFKFMDILIENNGTRISYEEICKSLDIEDDISDGTYKGNLIKLLRRQRIISDDEDFIDGKNKGYRLKF